MKSIANVVIILLAITVSAALTQNFYADKKYLEDASRRVSNPSDGRVNEVQIKSAAVYLTESELNSYYIVRGIVVGGFVLLIGSGILIYYIKRVNKLRYS